MTKKALLTTTALLLFLSREAARPLSSPPNLPISLANRPALIDVHHLGGIIEAEVIGEPCECQFLAGEIWENRGKSGEGFKAKKPSKEALKIARKVLTSQHEHSLKYFYNPLTATDTEFLRFAKRHKKVRCGRQMFF